MLCVFGISISCPMAEAWTIYGWSWIQPSLMLVRWQGWVNVSYTTAVKPSHGCFACSSFPHRFSSVLFSVLFLFFFPLLPVLSKIGILSKTRTSLGVGVKAWAAKTPSLTNIYVFLSPFPLGESVENAIVMMYQLPTKSNRERLTWEVNWNAQQFSSSSAKVCLMMSETQQD